MDLAESVARIYIYVKLFELVSTLLITLGVIFLIYVKWDWVKEYFT